MSARRVVRRLCELGVRCLHVAFFSFDGEAYGLGPSGGPESPSATDVGDSARLEPRLPPLHANAGRDGIVGSLHRRLASAAGGSGSPAQRQHDREDRSVVVVDTDRAAVCLDQAPGDAQAKASATTLLTSCAVSPVERFEEVREVFLRHSGAVVTDG